MFLYVPWFSQPLSDNGSCCGSRLRDRDHNVDLFNTFFAKNTENLVSELVAHVLPALVHICNG